MKRKLLLISIGFLMIFSFILGRDCAWAGYPERKIRFVVVFSPGGVSDTTTRALAQYVNPHLDGKVYVENVPGAGGAIGWREAAKAAPDGYTITFLSTAITIGPNTVKGYPTVDLFDPICIINLESRIILTKWDSRFKTVADVVSYAKKHPGEITGGTAGVGTINNLGMVAFAEATGIKLNLVPYKGDGPSLVAALGGHVDLVIASSPGAKPYVESKRLRPLVVLGPERYGIYPDVPTAKELGYDVSVVAFSGVGVPKGTPQEIKNILFEAFKKATQDEGYKKMMDKLGLKQIFIGMDEAGPFINAKRDFYKNLAIKIGLKPQ